MSFERPIVMMSAPDSGGVNSPISSGEHEVVDPLRTRVEGTVAFYIDNSHRVIEFDPIQRQIILTGETGLLMDIVTSNGGDFTKVNAQRERDHHFGVGRKMNEKREAVNALRHSLAATGIKPSNAGTMISNIFSQSLEFLTSRREGIPQLKGTHNIAKNPSFTATSPSHKFPSGISQGGSKF